MNNPQRWLHPDHRLTPETGVSFRLRYIGAVPVLVSIKAVDLELRTKIAHAAIHQACSDVGIRNPGSSPNKVNSSYLSNDTNRKWSLTFVQLTVTSKSLTVDSIDFNRLLFRHDLSVVSFASGGDAETMDAVCYVAKNSSDERLCYVFDCPEGVAQDVIMTLGQAFQLGFEEFKQKQIGLSTTPNGTTRSPVRRRLSQRSFSVRCQAHGSLTSRLSGSSEFEKSNERANGRHSVGSLDDSVRSHKSDDIGADPEADDTWLMNVPLIQPMSTHSSCSDGKRKVFGPPSHYVNMKPSRRDEVSSAEEPGVPNASVNGSQLAKGPSLTRFHELEPVGEPWYVGRMSRAEAEQLLRYEGDFLVRASPHQPGQFVLSGLQDTKCRHLLLADPQGQVRTRERVFDSIQHLVDYHVQNGIPIRSADSEIRLIFPVSANTLCEI